jgi:hypothetical protein
MMSAPLMQVQIQARANGKLPRVLPVTAGIEIDVAVELVAARLRSGARPFSA